MKKQFMRSIVQLVIPVCMLFGAVRGEEASDSLQAVDTVCVNNGQSKEQMCLTVKQPQASGLEKSLYWPTWWGYHASFVTDFALTGMIIDCGGREASPLYTLFGERNMVGVIGSAIVFHAAFSLVSWKLYKESHKRQGVWRFLMFAAATGINSYFLTVHTHATFGNIDIYNRIKE
jgi:hypothetical protein